MRASLRNSLQDSTFAVATPSSAFLAPPRASHEQTPQKANEIAADRDCEIDDDHESPSIIGGYRPAEYFRQISEINEPVGEESASDGERWGDPPGSPEIAKQRGEQKDDQTEDVQEFQENRLRQQANESDRPKHLTPLCASSDHRLI
ncbi:hypothetical protein [Methylocystis sp.]|uniref:hypothetical protein n=1 Tax=Methylocystis sp. TaxID=1911079 RepID=UPI003D0DFAC2